MMPLIDYLTAQPAPSLKGFLAPQSPFDAAIAQAKQKYPRIAKYPIALTKGTGPGFSETYPPDEVGVNGVGGNPHPGNWTIQLRSKEALADPSKWPDQIGLEMIHALQAKDPTYQKFTDQFLKSMTPQQQKAMRGLYARNKAENPEDTPPYDDWARRVQAQEYIRGGIFTDVIPNWIGPKGEGQYTPQQMKLLAQIKKYLQTP